MDPGAQACLVPASFNVARSPPPHAIPSARSHAGAKGKQHGQVSRPPSTGSSPRVSGASSARLWALTAPTQRRLTRQVRPRDAPRATRVAAQRARGTASMRSRDRATAREVGRPERRRVHTCVRWPRDGDRRCIAASMPHVRGHGRLGRVGAAHRRLLLPSRLTPLGRAASVSTLNPSHPWPPPCPRSQRARLCGGARRPSPSLPRPTRARRPCAWLVRAR